MKDTDNPIRAERIFSGTLDEFFKSLNAPKPEVAPPAACDCGYLEGYLAGIHSLSGHLLDELTA